MRMNDGQIFFAVAWGLFGAYEAIFEKDMSMAMSCFIMSHLHTMEGSK